MTTANQDELDPQLPAIPPKDTTNGGHRRDGDPVDPAGPVSTNGGHRRDSEPTDT
jgi:hypothetical protein